MAESKFDRFAHTSRLDFNDEQLKVLRSASYDIWNVLKPLFERQSNGLVRPYNSLTDYELKRELRFDRPSDYYVFKHDNVVIEIALRRKQVYSVAVLGFTPRDKCLNLAMKVPDAWISPSEQEFSNGYHFYGRFNRQHFSECVDLWLKMIINYLFSVYGLCYETVFKQLEFIF